MPDDALEMSELKGEETYFAVHIVCAKRLLDRVLKTKLLTKKEIKHLVSGIYDKTGAIIPLVRSIKVKSEEYANDKFVVTPTLAADLDYVEFGVHEGWEGK